MIANLQYFTGVYIFTLMLYMSGYVSAQNQTVAGDLTVDGRADIIAGPLSIGTASFMDDQSNLATAEGLTLHYSEISQIWDQGNYVPGRSTIIHRVAQELADFHWQVSVPDTLGGYDPLDLMKLSSEKLLVTPSIEGSGTENILPNQTLDGGASSILTKSLADALYLAISGGTVTGNVTFNGTVNVTTLGNSFTGLGTDYRLTNQVASHADSILTRSLADSRYLQNAVPGVSFKWGVDAVTTGDHSIALGYQAKANWRSVAIGDYSNYLGLPGEDSLAVGYGSFSPGAASVSLGGGSYSAGNYSISIGSAPASRIDESIAIGRGAEARRKGQIALGSFNLFQDMNHTPDPLDHIFVCGKWHG